MLLQQTAGYLLKEPPIPEQGSATSKGLIRLLNSEVERVKARLQELMGEGKHVKDIWVGDIQCELVELAKCFGWVRIVQFSEEALL